MSPTKPCQPTPRKEASSPDTTAERLKELAADAKLARLVATNPSASAELLLQLSHSDDKTVRKACTSNANTPVEALLKLGAQFPEQLLENPVFDLLLLAHPGLFEELPTSTLNSLLKRDQVPLELIRWAWKHHGESTQHSLLMNPNTPADVVEELCKAKDPEVRMAAELHCSRKLPGWAKQIKDLTDLENLESLENQMIISSTIKWDAITKDLLATVDHQTAERLVRFIETGHRERLARDEQTPSDTLAILAKKPQLTRDPFQNVRYWVAGNTATSTDTLSMLAMVEAEGVRMQVARNIKTPAEALTVLGQDPNSSVRVEVAGNRQTPVKVLTQLSMDPEEDVRAKVARNNHTLIETLTCLAKDPKEIVRSGVAVNEKTSGKILAHLAEESEWSIKYGLAANSATPGEVLTILAEDPDGSIRLELARNISTPVIALLLIAKDADQDIRHEMAQNIQMPAEVLALLAKDKDAVVRWAVAENSNTPAEVLSLLAKDPDKHVRRGVVGNDQSTTKLPSLLARDPHKDDCSAVIANSNTPKAVVVIKPRVAILVQICEDGCKGSEPSPGRRFLFTLPQCHANILAKNFRSRSWLERFAIAGNPSTPEPVLERMAQEGNQLVRRAASDNLARRASAPNQQTSQKTPTP